MLQAGIVGLPNAGKSTLFNALARAHAAAAPHPFTTVDPNVGEAVLSDPRLDRLAAGIRPDRVVPARVRFVDIAGLVRGAHRGEGLGNRFLARIREMDAVVLVLRAFRSPASPHPEGEVDPRRDLEILLAELALADLETAGRAAETSVKRAAATKSDEERGRATTLRRAVDVLDRGAPISSELASDELGRLGDLFLLTAKPFLVVLNVGEEEAARAAEIEEAFRPATPAGTEVVAVCAKLEEEVEDLPEEEAGELLEGYGIEERGTARVAEAARRLLGLITFYSIESAECRAWPVPRGITAQRAAAEIHTDMARGFIRADVVPADALAEAGSLATARERGMVRSEGKEYEVRDGDVLTFRFRT